MAELLERTGNKVKFKVTVPADEVNKAFTGVFNALSQQVRIPGFRAGKAPKSVIEKRVGKDHVISEVREFLLGQAYQKAVKELELIPVSASVEPGEVLENTIFEFTVDAENYPVIKLPSWNSFVIEAKEVEITDENVEQGLQELRERQARYDPVDRVAQAQDLITVEIQEGEDAGQTYPIYLERAESNVRNALLGQSANAQIDVPISNSDDQNETDENQVVQTLKVKIVDIKEKNIPALDDELAKVLQVENLSALKTKVREDLENRAKQQSTSNRKDEFIMKLSAEMDVEIPKAMIERRREALEVDLGRDLERQNVTLASYKEYLAGENKLEEFDQDLDKSALEAVRRDLALEQLSDDLKVELSEDEWRTAIINYAQANRVSVARLRELMGEDGLGNFKVVVTRDKALDKALVSLQ